MSILRLENISKEYDGKVVLKNINFETTDNEFIVLLGKTGCGKTTVLRIIAGLESPTTGRVFWDNKDITDLLPNERNISMIFQNYPVYSHLNVFDNIAIPLKLNKEKKDKIKKTVMKASQNIGIDNFLNRDVTTLSGGEQQKVAIAKSLIKNPNFFILDEPLSNIDTKDKSSFKKIIKDLHTKEKKLFIYVTHNQTEAISLANRIAIINESRIVQFASPEVLYTLPINAFVGQFFGRYPLNLLTCKIAVSNNKVILDSPFGVINIIKRRNELVNYKKNSILIGIRPHKIIISDSKSDLISRVKKIEYSWDSYLIWLKGHDEFFIHTNKHIGNNSNVYFQFPENELFFFDINTRERL